MGAFASCPTLPAPGAAAYSHWSEILPINSELTSPKQPVRQARAKEAGRRAGGGDRAGLRRGNRCGRFSSGSGLKRSILAAAATAAAPGQVKRDLSVLMEGCPASSPSRPKAARSPPGASGSRNEAPNLFSRATYLHTLLHPFLCSPAKQFRTALVGPRGSP